jgi:ankyrin repeat protein/L-ascorbate metabolism protein UlaG (beta-lactamase superfamily)
MIEQMSLIMDANKKNHSKKGSLQLHLAAVQGKLNKVKQLLAQGASINAKDREGYTALHRAVMMGKKEAAKFLIDAGAAVNTALPGGYTPLHEAAYGGHKDIVEKLIAAGADIYVEDSIKKTPVELASEQGHETLLDLLKPLHKAVEKGDIIPVKRMLDKEPYLLNAVDEKWRTPLYLAAVKGHKELARMLIDRGAELDTTERDGFSLLGRLRQKDFKELAELLTVRGVALSDRDMLDKELGVGEAITWYINGSGWVIKTRNHVLVFDHLPVRQLWSRKPALPFISFGEVNPNKIHDKRVSVFITHQHRGIPDVSSVISWERYIKNITYFFGWEQVTFNAKGRNPVTFTMNPGVKKNSSGLEILTVKAAERTAPAVHPAPSQDSHFGSGVGFLIKVDGLVIYYAGNHENTAEGMWQEYTREIDKIAKREKRIDLLFLTASGGRDCPVNKGAVYAVEKLSPGLMFPMHAGGKEYYYKEFAREIRNKQINTPINYAEKQGQRFIYKKVGGGRL